MTGVIQVSIWERAFGRIVIPGTSFAAQEVRVVWHNIPWTNRWAIHHTHASSALMNIPALINFNSSPMMPMPARDRRKVS